MGDICETSVHPRKQGSKSSDRCGRRAGAVLLLLLLSLANFQEKERILKKIGRNPIIFKKSPRARPGADAGQRKGGAAPLPLLCRLVGAGACCCCSSSVVSRRLPVSGPPARGEDRHGGTQLAGSLGYVTTANNDEII